MPKKRQPRKITGQDVVELEKVTTELRKGKTTKYAEPEDNYLIIKEDINASKVSRT